MTQPAAPTQQPGTPPAGDPPTTTQPPPAPPSGGQPAAAAGQPSTSHATDDTPLGEPGLRALQAEREARQALEKQIGELKPLLEFVQQIRGGQGVPDSQKTDLERMQEQLAQMQRTADTERQARLRLEVASTKQLSPQQAEWLKGTTREELEASADKLRADWGQPAGGPPAAGGTGTPAPDPTQGARGQGAAGLAQQIRDAEAKGDIKTSIRLKNQQALATTTQQR